MTYCTDNRQIKKKLWQGENNFDDDGYSDDNEEMGTFLHEKKSCVRF